MISSRLFTAALRQSGKTYSSRWNCPLPANRQKRVLCPFWIHTTGLPHKWHLLICSDNEHLWVRSKDSFLIHFCFIAGIRMKFQCRNIAGIRMKFQFNFPKANKIVCHKHCLPVRNQVDTNPHWQKMKSVGLTYSLLSFTST